MAASKEPRLPRTFPNHTEQTSIVLSACACTIISASPSTQDGLWIGGLVGGAQHQPCGVVLSRLPYYIPGAEDVRLHGLAGTTLQQRQVFVCRDVEDHIGPGEAEHLLNPGLVPDVRDDNARAVQQRLAIKFELKRVHVRLVVVEHVQASRVVTPDLSA